MSDHINIPVIEHDGYRWAALAYYGKDHEIIGESSNCIDQKYSFKGGHRVRMYRIRKQVYWRIPSAVTLDITNVAPRRIR
jgi:hypothetical protein